MKGTRVAVLRGGPSEEFDVSLMTGECVLAAIDKNRFEPIDIVVTKSGEWLLGGHVRQPRNALANVDVVFNAMHGSYGEDGTIQRLLENAGVPFTGSRSFSSAVAMNKAITKDRLREHNIKMAPHMLVGRSALDNIHGTAASIEDLLGPKFVVKPLSSGSSIGVEIIQHQHELSRVLRKMLEDHREVLVEKYIVGIEATCGVVERFRDQDLYALPAIEIIPPLSSHFFDYGAKYDGGAKEICPGSFTKTQKHELETLAKEIHRILELSQYSRSDFIVADDGVYFLEVNTLPGMTRGSLFPKALDAVGCSYDGFISHLLTDALENKGR